MNHRAKPTLLSLRPWRPLTIIVAACSLALAGCEGPSGANATSEPPLAGADIGGEFELVNSAGKTVRWSDFDGQYRIVYFGFTYCPDICPTDIQRMTQGLKQFGEANRELSAKVQPIFITIDPERDTGAVVEEFTSAFSDDLIGLTGTPEQIKAAADAFRVFYERLGNADDETYMMNHSDITYLFGPSGEPLATLPTKEGADAVTAELAKWVK